MFGALGLTEQKNGANINHCVVPKPHYFARPMRFGYAVTYLRRTVGPKCIYPEGLRGRRTGQNQTQSVLETDKVKALWDFKKRMRHVIEARRTNIMVAGE